MSIKTDKATVKKNKNGKVEAEARGFKVTLDVPETAGGANAGMTPVELLLSSIGACQVLTTSIFANYYGFNIDEISVELEGDKDPDGFSGVDPNVRSGFQKIRSHFVIQSSESEDRIKQLMEMVESKCPVEDSIKNGVAFEKPRYTLN